jgi:hypothetical protein
VFLQIYVNPDRDVVLEQIRSCEKYGVKALCVTVDSAVAGKRERDLRNKLAMQLGKEKQAPPAAKGAPARKAGSYANRDPALDWSDIVWFRKQTKIPIVIKGVQTADDAVPTPWKIDAIQLLQVTPVFCVDRLMTDRLSGAGTCCQGGRRGGRALEPRRAQLRHFPLGDRKSVV